MRFVRIQWKAAWLHRKVVPTVGSDAQHPDLCPRCAAVVKKLPVVE